MPVLIDLQNPHGFNDLPDISKVNNWCEASVLSASDKVQSVVIRIVDIAESADLNTEFRQKEEPTNILSFPDDLPDFMAELPEIREQPKHLGDLIICEPLLKKEAFQQNKILEQHWAHLIVHGILHLQGYDHMKDDDAAIMENLEIKILKRLGFNDPY